MEQKKALRKRIKDKISFLSPEYCQAADKQICRNVISLPAYKKADVIFCYVGTSREIDTTEILKDILASGKRLGVPRCISNGIMKVYEIKSFEDLKPGAYGIMEPAQHCTLIKPEEIHLAIVPCLSCTRKGARLGYGGGYYDRYLPEITGLKAVLCRAALLEETLPEEEHDSRMDLVITEET